MKVGDFVMITEEPWNMFSGQLVFVTKIDDDEGGFDFAIPEQRGHSPMKFAVRNFGNYNLEKVGIKKR